MSLLERFYPIARPDFFFFDAFKPSFEAEFQKMESEMRSVQEHVDRQFNQMRGRMFQLSPYEPTGESVMEIKPKHPIVEEKGETKLKLEFNVQGFKPEEVQVKVLGGNILQVVANSTEKSEGGQCQRHHVSQYTLPKGVLADSIKPVMSKDGVLTVEAPAPQLKAQEKLIPIEFKKA